MKRHHPVTITNSLAPSGVPDVQRQHSTACGLLLAGSPVPSGGCEAPVKSGGRPDQQECRERGATAAGASKSRRGEGKKLPTLESENTAHKVLMICVCLQVQLLLKKHV